MKIISIVNFKGGIAKTTTAIHLAASLSIKGWKTLVIDFDPQTSLSTGYKISKENQYTVFDFLMGNSGFRVTSKDDNLHVMAGSKLIISKTLDINILSERIKQLKKISEANNVKLYDYIIIDCPPLPMERMYFRDDKTGKQTHIPNLNEIALTASNFTMIPINAEEYSIQGLKRFLKDVGKLRNDFNPSLNIAGVFFTMVMKNEVDFKNYYKQIKESIPEKFFFKSFIRKDKNIEKSKKKGQSIFVKEPNSNAAMDYNSLCNELLLKLKLEVNSIN